MVKLLQTWLMLTIFFITSVLSEDINNIVLDRLKQSGNTALESFQKFTSSIGTFFKVNFDKIERKRRKIKEAILKFFSTVFSDHSSKTTTTAQMNTTTPSMVDFPSILPSDTKAHDMKILNYLGAKQKYNDAKATSDRFINSMPGNQFEDLVKTHGYKAETHTVVARDGYILTIHRIKSAFARGFQTKNEAVLLHHDILGSSDDWVLLGPKKALPYILLKANYDVWLTNARGNRYSTQHATQSIPEDEYWNFSWHEMGENDLPSVIDFIKQKNSEYVHLHFIGHGMGTTALLVLLSVHPEYNRVLKSAVLLAPMAYMFEVKGPMRLLSEVYGSNEDFRKYENMDFLNHDIPVPTQVFPWDMIDRYCQGDKMLCLNPLLLMTNGGQEIANKTLREAIQSHTPAGTSVRTLIHYFQLVKSGRFHMFNLGSKENLKKYGVPNPPTYILNDVTLPMVVFSSCDDWLSATTDVKSLLQRLPKVIMHHIVRRNEFSHTDFVWGEDADILIYHLIVDALKELTREKYLGY